MSPSLVAFHAITPAEWNTWFDAARHDTAGVTGRDVTPALLARLHQLSGGRILRANLALIRENARLAARLASRFPPGP